MAFYRAHIAFAMAEQQRAGVPALFNLAQSGVETRWARSVPRNNWFGMKPGRRADPQHVQWFWTREQSENRNAYRNRQVRSVREVPNPRHPGVPLYEFEVYLPFMSYQDEQASWQDHSRLLHQNPVYAAAWRHTDDPIAFASAIARHYATDRSYERTLHSAIRMLNRAAALIATEGSQAAAAGAGPAAPAGAAPAAPPGRSASTAAPSTGGGAAGAPASPSGAAGPTSAAPAPAAAEPEEERAAPPASQPAGPDAGTAQGPVPGSAVSRVARQARLARGRMLHRFQYMRNAQLLYIESSLGPAIQRGRTSTYRLLSDDPGNLPGDGSLSIEWTVHVGGAERDRYAQAARSLWHGLTGPRITLNDVGNVIIRASVRRGSVQVGTAEYVQSVTASGRSTTHEELIAASGGQSADPGVREWTTGEFARWMDLRILGYGRDAATRYIMEFKRQWVRGYRRVIAAAAARYNLPPVLLAGVVFNEVGGDPQWIDSVARAVRRNVGNTPSQNTSFGNVSTQIRRGAETLGYDPARLTRQQEDMIVSSLEDSRQNIFIAASHLADLRDIDFPGVSAANMTLNQMMVVATRFNRGPHLSLEAIRRDMSYGRRIAERFALLYDALRP